MNQVIGLVVESTGPAAQIGEICEIRSDRNKPSIKAEVVGFKSNRVLLMPLGDMEGIRPGAEVVGTNHTQQVVVGDHLLGRILDGLGQPIDGEGSLRMRTQRHTPPMDSHPMRLRGVESPSRCGLAYGRSTVSSPLARASASASSPAPASAKARSWA